MQGNIGIHVNEKVLLYM